MATGFRFLLRLDLVIVQPVVGPAMAMADSLAAFLRRVREMDSRRVAAAAVSFAARFWPVADLAVVVAFDLCRCPTRFATAGFVLAADPSDPADSDFAVVVVVVDLFDLSVVAAGPDSVGFAAFAVDFASSACSVAVALGKGRVVAVPFCSL